MPLRATSRCVRREACRLLSITNSQSLQERNGEAELSHDDPHAVKAMLEFVYISDYTYDTVAFSDTVGELTLHARVGGASQVDRFSSMAKLSGLGLRYRREI